jgi:hypothetical protein
MLSDLSSVVNTGRVPSPVAATQAVKMKFKQAASLVAASKGLFRSENMIQPGSDRAKSVAERKSANAHLVDKVCRIQIMYLFDNNILGNRLRRKHKRRIMTIWRCGSS